MTELEKVAYAKSFLDKMASGVNPLDDEPIPEGDLLRQARIVRCMSFVSSVLQQVIENGGSAPGSREAPAPFAATAEDVRTVTPDTEALPATRLCDRISAPFAGNGRKKLCYRELTGALTRMGLLEDRVLNNGKTKKRPTALGSSLGVLMEERQAKNGSNYVTVLYTPAAQQFVLDNFDAVMQHIAQIRDERKNAKQRRRRDASGGREIINSDYTEQREG